MSDKGQCNILFLVFVYTIFWNTSYFWQNLLGLADIGIFLLLLLLSLLLFVTGLVQLSKYYKEEPKSKFRLANCSLIALVLLLSTFQPASLLNWETLEGENLLLAVREGAANCMTIIKLKPHQKVKKTQICFGVEHYWGSYVVQQDTFLFYYNNGVKEHAVLKLDSFSQKYYLQYYNKDTTLPALSFPVLDINTKILKND